MANDKKVAEGYQTVNFHFSVNFDFPVSPSDKSNKKKLDIRFQSVTGLDATLETEPVKEGGENGFTHVIPVRRKYGPLVLKRGLISPSQSEITSWLQNAFDHEIVEPRDHISIVLLDEENSPLMHWTVTNVWPISWRIGELNAEQGAVLIETLELNYNKLTFGEQAKS
jgi:phage tail-like protein